MKRKLPPLLACFAPPAGFFPLVAGLGAWLERYPVYGPVNARSGQPWIPHYAETLTVASLTLLAATVLTSFFLLRRAEDGWAKVFAGAGLLLLIPVQAAFLLVIGINLFGK